MSKIYDAHENTYNVRDKDGNIKEIAPCYAEEEDSIVIAAREYELEQKKLKELEKQKLNKKTQENLEELER